MLRKSKHDLQVTLEFLRAKQAEVESRLEAKRNESKTPPKRQHIIAFNKRQRFEFEGDMVNVWSLRLQTFSKVGTKCVSCGVAGAFFAKEKAVEAENFWHLNLYAINEYGDEVLMTQDHRFPKSQGGKNTLENSDPMCNKCNTDKKDKLPWELIGTKFDPTKRKVAL